MVCQPCVSFNPLLTLDSDLKFTALCIRFVNSYATANRTAADSRPAPSATDRLQSASAVSSVSTASSPLQSASSRLPSVCSGGAQRVCILKELLHSNAEAPGNCRYVLYSSRSSALFMLLDFVQATEAALLTLLLDELNRLVLFALRNLLSLIQCFPPESADLPAGVLSQYACLIIHACYLLAVPSFTAACCSIQNT